LWTGYVLADDNPNELLVEYYSMRGRLLASEPVTYIARPPDDELVLAIVPSLRRSGLRSLINISSRGSESSGGPDAGRTTGRSGRYLLFTEKSLLPREALGYATISSFLWDGGDLAELPPEVALALKGWVYQGGTLVVAGGENSERVKQSFLNEILPVEILGTGPADLSEALRRSFGAAPAAGAPVFASFVQMVRGGVLLGSAERPLIVEGTYGAGRVVFVAFSLTSPALQKWEGRDRLLQKVFRVNRSRLLPAITAEARRTMDTRLKTNLLAELPTPVFIIAFLGFYILLVVPVNYFVFRVWKRLEYAWIALPVVAVAFGFLAYNIGYFSQSRTLDSDEITLVEGVAGSPVAAAKTFCAIYSPAGANETIRFPDRPVFSRPLLAEGFGGMRYGPSGGPDAAGAGRNPLTVSYGNGMEVTDFVINTWAARSLESDFVADLGGQIDASLRCDGQRLEGTVTNRLSHPLKEPRLVFPSGQTYECFDLTPGQTIRLEPTEMHRIATVGSRRETGPPPPTYRPGVFGENLNGEASLEQWMQQVLSNPLRGKKALRSGGISSLPMFGLSGYPGRGRWFGSEYSRLVPSNACLLLGWAPRSIVKPVLGGGRVRRELHARSQTLILMMVLPFEVSVERLASVSEALWVVEALEGAGARVARDADYIMSEYARVTGGGRRVFRVSAGENQLALRPMPDLRGRELDSVTIEFVLEKTSVYGGGRDTVQRLASGGFAVSLYDFAEGKWESFGSVSKIECKTGAQRFLDPVRQEIRMKIEVSDPEVQGGPNVRPGGGPVKACFVRGVRVNAKLK
jgi:hypothetical protein